MPVLYSSLLGFYVLPIGRVQLHLPGLIGTANHLDKQKIRIIEIFLEHKLHWQLEVRLLLFTVRTCI
jgi:hypothetical protein